MSIIVVRRYPQGPRCWVAGQRIHHGASGLVIAAALTLLRRRRLALLALVAVLDDRHDWRIWFAREGIPAGGLLDTAKRPL